MKLVFKSIAAIFLIAGIAFSQPKVFIDKHEIDLGTLYSGDKRTGKIIIKNTGNEPLHIEYVGSSCGCTTVKKPKEFLRPGESDYIEYVFRLFGSPEKAEKYINVETNDPGAKSLDIKISADIKETLLSTAGSNHIYLIENAVIKNPAAKKISLKNISGSPIVIHRDSTSSSSITVRMDKKYLRPDDTLNVDLTITPEKPGLVNEALYIITDYKDHTAVEVKITIFGTQGN
ncbi:MAG: DUF1573 domain-containing protein [Bacteroidetes bacterium]|nr:DUF1573 domain-containing protein [Bacteroidota bacterium]